MYVGEEWRIATTFYHDNRRIWRRSQASDLWASLVWIWSTLQVIYFTGFIAMDYRTRSNVSVRQQAKLDQVNERSSRLLSISSFSHLLNILLILDANIFWLNFHKKVFSFCFHEDLWCIIILLLEITYDKYYKWSCKENLFSIVLVGEIFSIIINKHTSFT